MADFKKLQVWQKAHALAMETHRVAENIRGIQHGALRTQLVRAAMSVPTNIVEGRSQQSEREFARFLRYALNSCSEVEYHLVAAKDLGVMRDAAYTSLTNQAIEVRKMLYGLLNRLSPSVTTAARPNATPAPRES